MNNNDSTATQYHVMVDGKRLGPFDKRTITGMRVKRVLTNDHVLFGDDGLQITVLDLLGGSAASTFGSPSMLQTGAWLPRYEVQYLSVGRQAYGGTRFVGQGEVRVQSDILRVAGPIKKVWWKRPSEGRIKIPLAHVLGVTRLEEHGVEIHLSESGDDKALLKLRLNSARDANEFVQFLEQARVSAGTVPDAVAHADAPDSSMESEFLTLTEPGHFQQAIHGSSSYGLWATILVVGLVLVMALSILFIIGMRKIAFLG